MRTLVLPLAFIAAALACTGCKRKQSTSTDVARVVAVDAGTITFGKAPETGDIHALQKVFQVGVYQLPRAKIDGRGAVSRLAKEKQLLLVSAEPKGIVDVPTVVVRNPKVAEYAPPSLKALRYSGRTLSDAQKEALQKTEEVTAFEFLAPASSGLGTYRAALEMAAAFAEQTGGLILDDETRETYTVERWRARLDGWDGDTLPIADHIVVHMYQDGELLRLVTLGMRKFGLPDVSVNQVAGHDASSMGTMVNLVCQSLLEGGALSRPGALDLSIASLRNAVARSKLGGDLREQATGKGSVRLELATPQEGDADNRLLEIVFPGPVASLQERHNALLSEMFGAHDEATGVTHDAALLAASKRARERMLTFKPRYAKGRPELERLLVKAPFKTRSGGNEWMWVEVTRWQGTTITGLLENDPIEVDDLHSGARVEVQEDVLFDYIFYGSDGGQEGNETGRMMQGGRKLTR